MSIVYDSTFSTEAQIARLQGNTDRADILTLADDCLQEYRASWARWLAGGDDAAYIAAVAAWEDREQLLGEVGYVP